MGQATLTTSRNKFGAGQLLMAPPGTAIPTLVCTAGTFGPVSAWTGWNQVGGTMAGLTVTRTPTVSDFIPAESYYATHILVTGDDIQGAFILNEVSKTNLAYAFNAGSAASVAGTGGNFTTSGTGNNLVAGFSLPIVGQEVHGMLGWQAQDDTEVLFIYQGLNVASVAPNFTKGPQAEELAITFRGELPQTNPDTNNGYVSTQTTPFRWYLAGNSVY